MVGRDKALAFSISANADEIAFARMGVSSHFAAQAVSDLISNPKDIWFKVLNSATYGVTTVL